MKWILYSLLLINIGFALWHYRMQGLSIESTPTLDEQGLHLILLKEYVERTQQQTNTGAVAASSEARCYTLGPFKSAKIAGDIKGKLNSAGIQADHRVSKDTSREGFWVFIPPQPSRKAAQDQAAKLKANNVQDYFVVVTGEYTNAVSLGVFSQMDLAQRRYEDLKGQGFEVRLNKVDLPVREYWLDWPVSSVLGSGTLETIRSDYPGVGQKERACQTTS